MNQFSNSQRISLDQIMHEVDVFVRGSCLALTHYSVAPDIYDRFKGAIDSVALERRRIYFYHGSPFHKAYSVKPDVVADLVNDTLNVLSTNDVDYEEALKIAERSGTVGLKVIQYLIKNRTRFAEQVKSLFIQVRRSYESDPYALSVVTKETLSNEMMDVVMAFINVAQELLSLIHSNNDEILDFLEIYDELLFSFLLSSSAMVANVLGHWCEQVLKNESKGFIDPELVIILIAIGCLLAYLLKTYRDGNLFGLIQNSSSRRVLQDFSDVVDIWNEVALKCRENLQCIIQKLQDIYYDSWKSSCIDALMSLMARR